VTSYHAVEKFGEDITLKASANALFGLKRRQTLRTKTKTKTRKLWYDVPKGDETALQYIVTYGSGSVGALNDINCVLSSPLQAKGRLAAACNFFHTFPLCNWRSFARSARIFVICISSFRSELLLHDMDHDDALGQRHNLPRC
jgi:hypothetical protein